MIRIMAGMWENAALLRGDPVCLICGLQGRGPILLSRPISECLLEVLDPGSALPLPLTSCWGAEWTCSDGGDQWKWTPEAGPTSHPHKWLWIPDMLRRSEALAQNLALSSDMEPCSRRSWSNGLSDGPGAAVVGTIFPTLMEL